MFGDLSLILPDKLEDFCVQRIILSILVSFYLSLYQALLKKDVSIKAVENIDLISLEQSISHLIIDGKKIEAENYILSDGAWTKELFPFLSDQSKDNSFD